MKPSSSLKHGGQDIVFVDVDSFSSLVKKYGADSAQVKEASNMLRGSIAQTLARVEKMYGDKVVVMTVMMSNDAQKTQIRSKRFISDQKVDVRFLRKNLSTTR